jgi:hypothetical protein
MYISGNEAMTVVDEVIDKDSAGNAGFDQRNGNGMDGGGAGTTPLITFYVRRLQRLSGAESLRLNCFD